MPEVLIFSHYGRTATRCQRNNFVPVETCDDWLSKPDGVQLSNVYYI